MDEDPDMDTRPSVWAAIDAAIQRRFDACMFFLMRLGLKKSVIRYFFWAVLLASMIVDNYCVYLNAGRKFVPSFIIEAVVFAVFFSMQRTDYHSDLQAETRGMRSVADFRMMHVCGLLKFVTGTGLLFWFIFAPSDLLHAHASAKSAQEFTVYLVKDISRNIDRLAMLSLMYLLKTPPTPPPIESKRTVLVPVTQRL
jgi:hypothetical protein